MIKPFSTKSVKLMLNSAALAVITSLMSCGESTSSTQGALFSQVPVTQPPANDNFNQSLLLQNLTDNVVVPTYQKFSELTVTQVSAVTDYCDALGTEATNIEEIRSSAQQSWRESMAVWQMAEVMQIGPLLENNSSLRNKIYSWPNVSSCAVDQDVILAEKTDYDISSRTASRKGLDAIEYLLFNTNLAHSCTVFGTEPADWNNRSDQDRMNARCNLAKLASTQLSKDANQLVDAWQGTNGSPGYADILKNAGQADNQFTDVHQAVNVMSDGLFYIDTVTKDAKLATPLGIFANDCGLAPCVQNVESQFAENSLENIISNVQALNMMFIGGETGIGFEDYLIDVGDTDTATKMRGDLTNLTEFASIIEKSLSDLLVEDPDQVQQVHDQLKKVTDTMKTDFIQSLALELPATSAGDND